MSERHPSPFALRGFLTALCLALLAGCLPHGNPAAAVPANLSAKGGNAVVTLTWTASAGATSYHVKRSTVTGGGYLQIAAPTSAGYTDTTVTNGTTYYYVVSSINTVGESANSPQVSATPAPTAPPAAPTDVVAMAGNAQVGLTWTASTGASSYHVKRATTSGGPYTQIAQPSATSYTDTSLINGTTYYYVVSAINSVGEGANSSEASASPSVPPPTTFGTWTNVTPANVDLTTTLCSNFGVTSVQVDPAQPSNLYTLFQCQGIWKSTDYGATWTGPISTGTNTTLSNQCSGGIKIPPSSTAPIPTLYEECLRGNGVGFWKSVDGGVDWTNHIIGTAAARQDYSPPAVDPYDPSHLLMVGHEFRSIVQSIDGGENWTDVTLASGMQQNGQIFFINTGTAATTRTTWLWVGGSSGGVNGTWRTVDGGAEWFQVDKNEGAAQIYQPDDNGVVFMSGNYSTFGSGVLRSIDYGQTWSHVGLPDAESVVFGTSKNVYAMFGFAVGPGGTAGPSFHVAAQPGTGTWVAPPTASGLTQGPAEVVVVNDGSNNIFLGAMFNVGMWRYVEP